MPRALIPKIPFGDKKRLPIDLLESADIDYSIKPLGQKKKEEELTYIITEIDIFIARTERITDRLTQYASRLKLNLLMGLV